MLLHYLMTVIPLNLIGFLLKIEEMVFNLIG